MPRMAEDLFHRSPPLTAEEQQRAREAIARSKARHKQLLAERGGVLFADSAELITQLREERDRELP